MDNLREIDFQLETPIEYATKGELEVGTFIKLQAPTSKNMNECAFLKQAFFRAVGSLPERYANQEGPEKEDEIKGEEIMNLITMSTGVELSAVLISAKTLFTSGIAMIEGETKLTVPLIDQMTQDDLEKMTGEYLANFTLASALRNLRKI